jgi:hypothetical protein
MSLWIYLVVIFAAGALGGAVNALPTDSGFILPRPEETNGLRVLRPGFLATFSSAGWPPLSRGDCTVHSRVR